MTDLEREKKRRLFHRCFGVGIHSVPRFVPLDRQPTFTTPHSKKGCGIIGGTNPSPSENATLGHGWNTYWVTEIVNLALDFGLPLN